MFATSYFATSYFAAAYFAEGARAAATGTGPFGSFSGAYFSPFYFPGAIEVLPIVSPPPAPQRGFAWHSGYGLEGTAEQRMRALGWRRRRGVVEHPPQPEPIVSDQDVVALVAGAATVWLYERRGKPSRAKAQRSRLMWSAARLAARAVARTRSDRES